MQYIKNVNKPRYPSSSEILDISSAILLVTTFRRQDATARGRYCSMSSVSPPYDINNHIMLIKIFFYYNLVEKNTFADIESDRYLAYPENFVVEVE